MHKNFATISWKKHLQKCLKVSYGPSLYILRRISLSSEWVFLYRPHSVSTRIDMFTLQFALTFKYCIYSLIILLLLDIYHLYRYVHCWWRWWRLQQRLKWHCKKPARDCPKLHWIVYCQDWCQWETGCCLCLGCLGSTPLSSSRSKLLVKSLIQDHVLYCTH